VDIESSHQGTTVSLFLPKAHQPAPIQETTHFQRA